MADVAQDALPEMPATTVPLLLLEEPELPPLQPANAMTASKRMVPTTTPNMLLFHIIPPKSNEFAKERKFRSSHVDCPARGCPIRPTRFRPGGESLHTFVVRQAWPRLGTGLRIGLYFMGFYQKFV